jgi:hypothetical protein
MPMPISHLVLTLIINLLKQHFPDTACRNNMCIVSFQPQVDLLDLP